MDSINPAATTQKKGRPSPFLQRPDHRAGEEVWDTEISLTPREETTSQDAAAQWETGKQNFKCLLLLFIFYIL